MQGVIESARGSPECSGIAAAVFNILRQYIDSEPACAAAHGAATALYDSSGHSNNETLSFLGYGSLVLAVNVLHAVQVMSRQDVFRSAGIPEGHGGVMQLSVAVGLGSDAAWTGTQSTVIRKCRPVTQLPA